jgi:EAL domain-containing protein (putative c-di-GMP-specific phosphodiesterase class I)
MSIQQVMTQRLLSPHFQPIVAVSEGRVGGYEALIRGPEHLALREPVALFKAAAQAGLLRELERACWSAIVEETSRNLDRIPHWARIFLNVLPEDILDPSFLTHVIAELEKTHIDPARLSSRSRRPRALKITRRSTQAWCTSGSWDSALRWMMQARDTPACR